MNSLDNLVVSCKKEVVFSPYLSFLLESPSAAILENLDRPAVQLNFPRVVKLLATLISMGSHRQDLNWRGEGVNFDFSIPASALRRRPAEKC